MLRLFLAVVCLSAACTPAWAGTKQRPNIVILYADDMAYGDLGIQNPESKIPTPHLDRLAREGTRFTDAHSSSGICTPSRYALLTGRYHWRKFHGIVNSFDPPSFDPGQLTLARMLQRIGYRTACIGKWHLGWDWNAIRRPGAKMAAKKKGFPADAFDWSKRIPGGPLDRGFDTYFGDDVPNFPPYAWIENDRVVDPPTTTLALKDKTAEGSWEARPGPAVEGWRFEAVMPRLTEKAVEWIGKQKKGEPFFLYFPFTSPHAPIVPTMEFLGKSKAGGYGDFMAETDWTVGQVLKALADHGFAENTIVVFTSDNGPEGYAFERIRRFLHRSMGPLRGVKRDIWEGGHRVPFIVRWPGVVKAGRVSDALVSQVDLFATLAAVLNVELPAGTAEDSHDLLPLWKGKDAGPRRSHVHNTFKDHYAIRVGDWVLIDAKSGQVTKAPAWYDEMHGYQPNSQPVALFNLREDLGQRHNLAAKHPERVRDMQELLKKTRGKGEVR